MIFSPDVTIGIIPKEKGFLRILAKILEPTEAYNADLHHI